jgi:hypothetical protein
MNGRISGQVRICFGDRLKNMSIVTLMLATFGQCCAGRAASAAIEFSLAIRVAGILLFCGIARVIRRVV